MPQHHIPELRIFDLELSAPDFQACPCRNAELANANSIDSRLNSAGSWYTLSTSPFQSILFVWNFANSPERGRHSSYLDRCSSRATCHAVGQVQDMRASEHSKSRWLCHQKRVGPVLWFIDGNAKQLEIPKEHLGSEPLGYSTHSVRRLVFKREWRP